MSNPRKSKKGAEKSAPDNEPQGFPAAQRKALEKEFVRERDKAPCNYRRSSATKFVASLERIAWNFETIATTSESLTPRQQRAKLRAAGAAFTRAATHLNGLGDDRHSLIAAMWQMNWKTGRERFARLGIGPGREYGVIRSDRFSSADALVVIDRAIDLLKQAAAAVPHVQIVECVSSAGYGPANSAASDLVEVFTHFGLKATFSANGFAVRCYNAIAKLAGVDLSPSAARSRMEWAINYAETAANRFSRPQRIVVPCVGGTDPKMK